jgi:glyoxylate reductase
MSGRPVVVVTRRLPEAVEQELARDFDARLNRDDRPLGPEGLMEALRGADAVLCTVTDRLTDEVMGVEPRRARLLANFGVGFNHIDVDAARRHGLSVSNTPDVLTDATADIAFALLLGIARRIVEGEREVREGRWAPWHPSHMLGGDLAGQTLGIVGWGRIGQAMARRGEGFGMRIVHSSRSSGIALEELLEQADYVSVHTPLTPETRHLIATAELKRMKPTAYLINTSRGGTVDQVALREALEAGEIAGAGLDVTDPEPLPADDPLLTAPNLLVVPHVGSATVKTRSAMADLAVDNLLAALAGEEMPHRVA